MLIKVYDQVNDDVLKEVADFDLIWGRIGEQVKKLLAESEDHELTWLNVYLSNKGKPQYVRTLEFVEEPTPRTLTDLQYSSMMDSVVSDGVFSVIEAEIDHQCAEVLGIELNEDERISWHVEIDREIVNDSPNCMPRGEEF